MAPDPDQLAVLEALLAQVPVDGWTQTALRNALLAMGRPAEEARLVFPNGVVEMIESFFAQGDRLMEEAAAADAGLMERRVPERVRGIIALRLAQGRPHKQAIRRAAAVLALPIHAAAAARITARSVDAIWHAAGDISADFSWYSKRAILAGVYGATMLYWLRDDAVDDAASLAFLDRRLADVARVGKARKKLDALFKFRGA